MLKGFTSSLVLLKRTSVFRGQTALHKAAWEQRRSICCMLVAKGASLTATDLQVSIFHP